MSEIRCRQQEVGIGSASTIRLHADHRCFETDDGDHMVDVVATATD